MPHISVSPRYKKLLGKSTWKVQKKFSENNESKVCNFSINYFLIQRETLYQALVTSLQFKIDLNSYFLRRKTPKKIYISCKIRVSKGCIESLLRTQLLWSEVKRSAKKFQYSRFRYLPIFSFFPNSLLTLICAACKKNKLFMWIYYSYWIQYRSNLKKYFEGL